MERACLSQVKHAEGANISLVSLHSFPYPSFPFGIMTTQHPSTNAPDGHGTDGPVTVAGTQTYFVIAYELLGTRTTQYPKAAYALWSSAQKHVERIEETYSDITSSRICEVVPTRWGRERLTSYGGVRERVLWANDCDGKEREFWLQKN